MDFKVEDIGPCRKKIVVTISPERVGEAYDKKYDEINESVPLPGFRPGRAPRVLLEKRFGKRLVDEIKGDLVKAALEELFEGDDAKVEPLAPPDLDIEALELVSGAPFTFDFELVTKPEFETPTYKGLEVKVPPVEVSEEEIDGAVDRLRRRNATLETIEGGTVEDGDVLIVDWEAKDGDSVESRDDNAYYPYGRGVLAGFVAAPIDEHLAGASVGAKATAPVQVAADDPREELRGRELELHVELKEIKRYALPPIDAAFLGKHDYDDVDEMRADVKKQIHRAKARGRDGLAENLLVDQLLGAIEMSLPEEFVAKELEHWALRKRMSLQMEKLEDEEISKQIDAARADTQSAIESDMRRHFLLERIAHAETIDVTEAEMMQSIQDIAMAYGHPIEQVLASFRDGGRLAELQSEIRHRKARAAIREAATLVEDASLLEDTADAGSDPQPAEKQAAKKKAPAKKAAKKKASN